MGKSRNLKVLSEDFVQTLLREDTQTDLKRIGQAKIALQKRNLEILQASSNPILFGIGEDEGNLLLSKLRSLDPLTLDTDISLDLSRGLISIGQKTYFWAIDYLDESTLTAKLNSDLFSIGLMDLSQLFPDFDRKRKTK